MRCDPLAAESLFSQMFESRLRHSYFFSSPWAKITIWTGREQLDHRHFFPLCNLTPRVISILRPRGDARNPRKKHLRKGGIGCARNSGAPWQLSDHLGGSTTSGFRGQRRVTAALRTPSTTFLRDSRRVQTRAYRWTLVQRF